MGPNSVSSLQYWLYLTDHANGVGGLQLLLWRQIRLSSPPDPARGPVPVDRFPPAPGGTAAVGMALSMRTTAMAAAVAKVSVLRTRLRAEAPSKSSASCSPSELGVGPVR